MVHSETCLWKRWIGFRNKHFLSQGFNFKEIQRTCKEAYTFPQIELPIPLMNAFMPSPLVVGDQLTFVSVYIVVLTNGGPIGDLIDWTLTHWGQVMHICISRLTITGSDNDLSPGRHQAIIWTNAGIFLIGPLGTNFNENLIEILAFSFAKKCCLRNGGHIV